MSGQGESALLENLQKSREKDKFCSTAVSEKHQVTLLSKKPINDILILKGRRINTEEWKACGKNLSREKEPLILDQSIPEASYAMNKWKSLSLYYQTLTLY